MKLSVALRVWGDSLDPAAITSLLGVAPSRSWRRGDVLKLVSGNETAPKKTGLWSLSTDADGGDADQALGSLLSLFNGRARLVNGAPGVDLARFDIFVIDEAKSMSQYQLLLSADTLKLLGEIGIPIEINLESFDD